MTNEGIFATPIQIFKRNRNCLGLNHFYIDGNSHISRDGINNLLKSWYSNKIFLFSTLAKFKRKCLWGIKWQLVVLVVSSHLEWFLFRLQFSWDEKEVPIFQFDLFGCKMHAFTLEPQEKVCFWISILCIEISCYQKALKGLIDLNVEVHCQWKDLCHLFVQWKRPVGLEMLVFFRFGGPLQ